MGDKIKMIMRCLFLCVVLFVAIGVNAQSYDYRPLSAKKAVFVEFLGASMLVGVNYDSRFYEDSRWGYRVGLAHTINELEEIGVCSCGGDNDGIYGFNVPLEINYLVGRRETRNKLDLGMGLNLGCYEKNEEFMFGYFAFLNIGYRFQPRNGLIFRIGLSPKFDFGESSGVGEFIWLTSLLPYLSFGYSF